MRSRDAFKRVRFIAEELLFEMYSDFIVVGRS